MALLEVVSQSDFLGTVRLFRCTGALSETE